MFEEIAYIVFACVCSALAGVCATYFMGKRMVSDDKIMEKLSMIIENITTDAELQKQVYSIGLLLGSGIAKGTGLQGGGKFKFQDIIGQGIVGWINKMIGGNPEGNREIEVIPPQKKW